MKRIVSILAALALALCLAIPAAGANAQRAVDAQSAGLKFKPDGTFKIIQVSDTQEFFFSSTITQDFLYDLAKNERPDLFVLTGDNVRSADAKQHPAFFAKLFVRAGVENLMCAFDRIYRDFGIPMTMVYGNHDNEAGQDIVTRAEQFAMYARHECFVGYYIPAADEGTEDDQGQHYGTHNIVIKNSAGTAPAFNIWMFDSGAWDPRGGYSCVQRPQIDWFESANDALGKLPSLAFQHIIVRDVLDFFGPGNTLPAGTQGEKRKNPGPSRYNEGQYAALNAAGNVLAVFSGHDHTNTFVLQLPGTDIVNSPGTGFGSYGDVDLRGVRVITLDESDLSGYGTDTLHYMSYYGQGGLRQSRLEMYQARSTAATLLDWMSFKPLLWLLGLFRVTNI